MPNVVKPGIIVKTPGPTGPAVDGVYPGMRGHCYNATGWQDCAFWNHSDGNTSRCMLFGGIGGVEKTDSEALVVCDKVYGVDYEGKP